MARLHTVPSRLAAAPVRLTSAAPASDGSGRFRRLYRTKRWLDLRRRVLVESNYTCAMCGVISERLVCDHVRPHTTGETEEQFWAGPFQALCPQCHSSKKQAMDAAAKAGRNG